MTKIWMKEVYDKGDLNTLLDESFLRVLSNHREQGIKETMNKSFTGFSLDESRIEMPKSLYISLNTRKKYRIYGVLNKLGDNLQLSIQAIDS